MLNHVVFDKKIDPVNGSYEFIVTETITYGGKTLRPSYKYKVPAELVKFELTPDGYALRAEERAFAALRAKQESCGINEIECHLKA